MEALCGCLVNIAEHAASLQCGYIIKYKSNIRDLDIQIQKLDDRRVAVKKQMVAAEENLETVLPEVESWLSDVEAAIKERENVMIFEEDNISKAWCCYGRCPNPKACHYFGKKAKKMAIHVKDLHVKGNFTTIAYISASQPRNNREAGTSSGASCPDAFESRASVVRDVMEALKDSDSNPVIIFGMSGIGKTTMLKEIYKSEEASSLFDKVLLVQVSRTEDYLHKLQKEIADPLGLKRLSDHTNLVERAELLSKRLMSQKVLVMLDDVWERIDFEEVGIRLCGDCKVLISTRFHHLYREVAAERKFIINGLTQEEAWSLFKETAGSGIESTWLKPIAEKIVQKCDGLPIAISTMGRALHGKRVGSWNDALRQLENPSPESVLEEEVVKKLLPNIEFCYNCLQSEEAKSFFFLCCLYPEGSDIQVEDLVRHGLGLGLFMKTGSMVEGRNRVEALIDRLKDRSLLLDSNKKGSVKMHDLVRKVALLLDSPISHGRSSIIETRNRFFVSYGSELMSEWLRYSEVPGSRKNLILLSHSDDLKKRREATLKVLDCKRLSSAQPLFQRLKTIQTLCLEHCDLGDVSIIGKLKTLMILSLRHSSMNELPQSFKNLSNLWLLDLTGCSIPNPEIISSGIISGLNKLQELYMLVQRTHEESIPRDVEEQDKVVSELRSWQCSLTTFEADLPEVSFKSLQRCDLFDKLERFKISIGCSGRWDSVPIHNNCLRLNVDAKSLVRRDGNTNLLEKTQTLEIAMNVLEGECFDELKCLKFEGEETLEDIVSDTLNDIVRVTSFPVLRSMTIKSSKMLMSICINHLRTGLFQELRCVELHSYPSLSSLFSLPMARGDHLHQLEELDIRECSGLKEIVASNGVRWDQNSEICKIPNLIRLELVDLENFIGFSQVSICFPLLINIQLKKLSKLVALCPPAPESSSSATTQHLFDAKDESLLELRFVKVLSCNLISSMFSSNSMQSLQNLEDLTVEDCRSLRTLFNFEYVNTKVENAYSTLSCIAKMTLIGLPKLEYIWKPYQKIQAFQSLRNLKIDRCGRLKNVFPCYIAEGLVQLEEFSVSECDQMREIIYIDEGSGDREFETSTTKTIVFSKVEKLELKKLPSLVRFCGAPCKIEWPSLRKLVLTDLQKVKTCFVKHSDDVLDIHAHVFNEKVDFPILEELMISDMPGLLVVVPSHMQQRFQELKALCISGCESVKEIFEFRDVNTENAPPISDRIMGLKHAPAFQNLKTLNVSQCSSLRTLVSLSMARSLVMLKELSVCSCHSIEEIVSKLAEGEEAEDNTSILPNLFRLTLNDLPNLATFTEGKYNFDWRFLNEFKFWGCPDMRTFCFGSVRTPMLSLVQLSVDGSISYISYKDLNITIPRIYKGEGLMKNDKSPKSGTLALERLCRYSLEGGS